MVVLNVIKKQNPLWNVLRGNEELSIFFPDRLILVEEHFGDSLAPSQYKAL